MKKATVTIMLFLVVGMISACAREDNNVSVKQEAKKEVSLDPEKQTKLELYLTAAEAYDKWKADPENIIVLDVRTPEEYIFVGHPEMAWNVPLKMATYETADGKTELVMKLTPDFVERVKEIAKPDDTIFITCRSGGRSAAAVDLLADEGFKNVYNITDGFEGDKVKDPKSPDHGKRLKNGWRNAGRPWTYDVKSEKIRLYASEEKPAKEEEEKEK